MAGAVKKVCRTVKNVTANTIKYVKEVKTFVEDVEHIIVSNVDFSAGICIGMGWSCSDGGIGVEAITRMDIIGVQLNDGDFRIGHIGRSALTISVGSFTVGPQSDTYEDFGINTREVSDPYYTDVGLSSGVAKAFGIGYHFEYSISFSGMKKDFINYLNS